MKKRFLLDKILIGWLIVVFPNLVSAKQTDTVSIRNMRDTASVFAGDTVVIYGNIEHQGALVTTPGSYLFFKAERWKNSNTSRFINYDPQNMQWNAPDGGVICFKPSSNISQQIIGGYLRRQLSGPVFPNIEINNPNNVFLDSSDLGVMNKIFLNAGLFYLFRTTANSLVLGGGKNRPAIVNYNKNRFLVTGSDRIVDTNYIYYRNVAPNDSVVYPYGSAGNSFTPARFTNQQSTSADFVSRVFDGVYQNGNTGTRITDTTFLQKTWYLENPGNTIPSFRALLQNTKEDEPVNYWKNRANSFISIYNASQWDTLRPINSVGVGSVLPTGQPDIDSVFYHWRNLDKILNPPGGIFLAKRFVLDSKTILPPVFSLTLVGQPQMNAIPGTYNLMYRLVVSNPNLKDSLTNISISDNLRNVFPSPVKVTVISVNASKFGTLNLGYNGITDTTLLRSGAQAPLQMDSIFLLITIDLNGTNDSVFTNIAHLNYSVKGAGGISITSSALVSNNVRINLSQPDVYIPEGFSPNGDGINDKLIIRHKPQTGIGLKVFNRWGTVVYENSNYQDEWDGRGKGSLLGSMVPDGTYYVVITATNLVSGKKQQFVQFITIKR